MQPKEVTAQELEANFHALADRLEMESQYFSFIGQMAEHLANHQIVEMGDGAIPLILRRLEQQGGLWYHALETITGTPSPAGITKLKTMGWHAVDVPEVNAAWLRWGREQGYSW